MSFLVAGVMASASHYVQARGLKSAQPAQLFHLRPSLGGPKSGFAGIANPLTSLSTRGELIQLRQFRDHLAVANYFDTDASGCVSSITILGLSDNDPVINQGVPGLSLLIWRYDACNDQDQLFLEARVPVPLSDFEINPSLHEASLHTIVPVFDFVSGNNLDISIDLTWTASGPMQTDLFHGTTVAPGIVVATLIWNSFWRPGDVSGSITDGNSDYTYQGASKVGVLTKTVLGSMVVVIERS
jgi:hypothetical protein